MSHLPTTYTAYELYYNASQDQASEVMYWASQAPFPLPLQSLAIKHP